MIRITRNDDIAFNVDEVKGKGERYNITFYTTNNAVNISKTDQDVNDGIIVLNGSELMALGEGVMNFRVDNIAPNADYNDGVFNSSFTKTTKYYILSGIIVPDGSDTQSIIEIVGELQDAIGAEVTRSTTKDNAHDTAIANEATARANADSALSDRITANATAIANTYTKTEIDDMLDDLDVVLPDNIVIDANYTHTDNNYTTTEKNKLAGIASGAEVNVQSDWNVTNTSSDAFIKNKPTNVSSFSNDAGYLTSYTETDPTVPAWAKAQTKPTYTASEVGALPSDTTIPSKTSDLTNDSGFVTGSKIYVGTCDTAPRTMPKVCTVENFPTDGNGKPLLGTTIAVKYSVSNMATSSNKGLDVNGTGSAPVYYDTDVSTLSAHYGYADRYIQYLWDGNYWVFLSWSYDDNTTYTNTKLGQGYGTQDNLVSSSSISVSLRDYQKTANGIVCVKFTYDVPAGATLNINGTGASAIYNKNAAIAAGVIHAGDTATFIYNTYYILISVDSWQDNTGGGGSSSGDGKQQTIIKMNYANSTYSFTDIDDTAMTDAEVIQLLNDTDKDVRIIYHDILYIIAGFNDDGTTYHWTFNCLNGGNLIEIENDYDGGGTTLTVNIIQTGPAPLGWCYAYQNNMSTTAITAANDQYVLTDGGFVVVKITRAIQANATLNINGTGAKQIYHKGAAINAAVLPANCFATFVFADDHFNLIDVAIAKSNDYCRVTPTIENNVATYTLNGYGSYLIYRWNDDSVTDLVINLTKNNGTDITHTLYFDDSLSMSDLSGDVTIQYNGQQVCWRNGSPNWQLIGDGIEYIVVKIYNSRYATYEAWGYEAL